MATIQCDNCGKLIKPTKPYRFCDNTTKYFLVKFSKSHDGFGWYKYSSKIQVCPDCLPKILDIMVKECILDEKIKIKTMHVVEE